MRSFGSILLIVGILSCPATANAANAPSKPTNVVVIMTDDQGYGDIGLQGSAIPTPYLDALAKGGVRCTDGYVCCPVCSPSRAGMLTGRYPQRFGFEFNPGGKNSGLDVGQRTIADLMRERGYATGLIGKWHLGMAPQFHPLERGFDEFYGMVGGAHHYLPAAQVPPPRTPAEAFIYRLTSNEPITHNRTPVPDSEYLTDEFARQAELFIERNRAQPFLLVVCFNTIHVPLQATKKYLDRFPAIQDETQRTYAAMLSALDDAVGVIERKLENEGLDEQTLVFYLSDNGGHTPSNAKANGKLRAGKSTAYEGGIRVPFFVKWKGKLPSGVEYSQPVSALDILPTSLAAAGIAVPAERQLDGVNLLPFLTGERSESPHASLYWRYGEQRAIRHGSWKLVIGEQASHQLFNLVDDRSETTDQAQKHPEIVSDLLRRYEAWSAELEPPRWRSIFDKNKKATK